MICKDFEKLIHLYLDQKLDEQKKKEVEKHLAECQKCREKFETLKLVEKKAKGIKIPEPGDTYWESFSQRVRQRIVSQQKQTFGVKLKESVSNIFIFTPARLRVAAALVSIVLVFIVGKLYIDYRGTIPQRIKPAEKEIPKIEKSEKVSPAPGVEEEKPIPATGKGAPTEGEEKKAESKEPEIENEKLKMQKEKLTISEEAELKEVDAGKGAELTTKKPIIGSMRKGVTVPEIAEQEALKPVEKEEAPKATMRVMADVEDKKAKPESKVMGGHTLDLMTLQETHEYLFADSIQILDVDYHHGYLNADSLRVIIDFWKKFIKENPDDSFVEYAYLQIAASYYYLFEKTKDETVRAEGIKQIEAFQKVSKEEETKENLRQRLEKLKGLKEK